MQFPPPPPGCPTTSCSSCVFFFGSPGNPLCLFFFFYPLGTKPVASPPLSLSSGFSPSCTSPRKSCIPGSPFLRGLFFAPPFFFSSQSCVSVVLALDPFLYRRMKDPFLPPFFFFFFFISNDFPVLYSSTAYVFFFVPRPVSSLFFRPSPLFTLAPPPNKVGPRAPFPLYLSYVPLFLPMGSQSPGPSPFLLGARQVPRFFFPLDPPRPGTISFPTRAFLFFFSVFLF